MHDVSVPSLPVGYILHSYFVKVPVDTTNCIDVNKLSKSSSEKQYKLVVLLIPGPFAIMRIIKD